MASNWNVIPASKYCDIIFDGTHDSPPKKEEGFYLITTRHLLNGSIDFKNAYFISEQDFCSISKRSALSQWDVLISMIGTIGTLYIEKNVSPTYAIKNIGVFSCKDEINSKWLYYYLSSPKSQGIIKSVSRGTTQQYIPLNGLRAFPITNPPKGVKENVVQCLGTLDDKIELNRQTNKTLEAMAQAIFKSWFVDFDPVIDNALAVGNEIPDALKKKADARIALGDDRKPLPEDIRKLFPSSFVFTEEMGWVPEGWDVSTFKKVAKNPKRGIMPCDIEKGTPYIGLQDMPQKSIALTSWGVSNDIGSNKHFFNKGEILFGKLRPYFHKIGVAPITGVCSTDILVVLPKKKEWFSIVLGHVMSAEFIEYVTNRSTGTRMPRTNWKDMGAYQLVIPNNQISKVLSDKFQDFIAKIHLNIAQSNKLTSLRDTLLPKLLSGELRIPDVKKLIKD
ncbi:MAG: restriction endonuclease subunit S [Desulfobacteraceae bacterium]|nr:restriction endonuclease subunit S [Desulfobacteraceae bacterium]